VVNTFEAKVVQSIKGLNEPQGVLYVPEFNKLFVANAETAWSTFMTARRGSSQEYLNWREADTDNLRMMMLPNGFLSASWAASP